MPRQDKFLNEVYGFFSQRGLQPHQAAAFAGNMRWESGGKPNLVNPNDNWKNSPNSPHSIGIGQWNDRVPKLIDYARRQGVEVPQGDLKNVNYARQVANAIPMQTQLGFAWQELNTTERYSLDRMKSARTLRQANEAAIGYHRPAGYTRNNPSAGHAFDRRLALANSVVGAPVQTGSGDGTTPMSNRMTAAQAKAVAEQSGPVPDRKLTKAEVDAVQRATFPKASTVPGMALQPGALPPGIIPPPRTAAVPEAVRMAEGGRAGSPPAFQASSEVGRMSEGGRAEPPTPGVAMSEGGRAGSPPVDDRIIGRTASEPMNFGKFFEGAMARPGQNAQAFSQWLADRGQAPASQETPSRVPQTQYGPNSQTPAAPITALDQGGPDAPAPAPAISAMPDGGMGARAPFDNFRTPSMIGPTDATPDGTPNSGLVGGGVPNAGPQSGGNSYSQAADRASAVTEAERRKGPAKENPLDFYRPAGSEQWPDWAVKAFNQDVYIEPDKSAANAPLKDSGGAASLPAVPKFGDIFEGGFKKPIFKNFFSGMFGG